MKIKRAVAASIIVASLGVAAMVDAQTLRNAGGPAEFPPASFKGKQFVDSNGCVYVRAGVDGAVSWVPRVSRKRKQLCGYKPSFAKSQTTTQPAAKLDKNVVQIVPDQPLTETPAPKPKAVVAAPAPKPKPQPVAIQPAPAKKTKKKIVKKAAQKKPVQIAPAAPAPVQKPVAAIPAPQQPRASGNQSHCRAGSAISQQYSGAGKHNIRCGPQQELPYTPGTGNPTSDAPVFKFDRRGDLGGARIIGQVVRRGEVGPHVRVIPRHVFVSRQLDQPVPTPPPGYRSVWDDDRLNPRRAEMDFAGMGQMERVWKNRVPLKYRKAKPHKSGSTKVFETAGTQSGAILATTSRPAQKSLRLGGRLHAQVNVAGGAAQAQAMAREVKALGLPVRIGKYSRNGADHRMVLAGPFANESQLSAALQKMQSAGFTQAIARR